MTPEQNIAYQANEIAVGNLRSNYQPLGILAGPENHAEYVTRDGFFASLGACALGDYDPVRATLNLALQYQKEDGQIPLRVEERNHALNYMKVNVTYNPPLARYKSSQLWAGTTVDTSALFIISAMNYVRVSGDRDWLKENLAHLEGAAEWLLQRKNGLGLIEEEWMASWADMIPGGGSVTYTNVLTWKALDELSRTNAIWTKERDDLKLNINDKLWDKEKGYFADRIGKNGKVQNYFFADGNLLAISWGLVDNGRAEEIYDYIDSYSLNEIPIIVCHPRLPRAIDLFVKVVLPYYHPTKRIFAWWGPWEIMERYKLGDKEGAIRGLTALSQVITANETVPEVFNKKGRIVDGTIFKPERGVSWGAGTLIYMMNELEKMGAFK